MSVCLNNHVPHWMVLLNLLLAAIATAAMTGWVVHVLVAGWRDWWQRRRRRRTPPV